jgi:hypothetical protein
MFILKILCAIEEDSSFGWREAQGAYPSLEAAIAAAISADMDRDCAVIEKENGVQASVNDWIAVRTAGGNLDVG